MSKRRPLIAWVSLPTRGDQVLDVCFDQGYGSEANGKRARGTCPTGRAAFALLSVVFRLAAGGLVAECNLKCFSADGARGNSIRFTSSGGGIVLRDSRCPLAGGTATWRVCPCGDRPVCRACCVTGLCRNIGSLAGAGSPAFALPGIRCGAGARSEERRVG